MRIVVVSDTHGDKRRLQEVLLAQPAADALIHLGDGVREAEELVAAFPRIPFYIVRGNCDWESVAYDVPTSRLERLGGVRVFCTHGHLYEVKSDLLRVAMAAREMQAAVLLYGHTHRPHVEYRDGLHILNPGSIRCGYGLLDITPAGIHPHLVEVSV